MLWELTSGQRRARVRVGGRLSANNFETVSDLAIRGHGIAFLPSAYALAGERDGVFQRVLPRWASANVPVHAVYMGRALLPANLKAFLDALLRWESASWDR